MAMNRCCAVLLSLLAIGATTIAMPEGLRAETVGTAGAVRPAAAGTPPGGSARTLEVGSGIVSRERIETTTSGSVQVMFNDRSTLTVGPNSDLVIDEFVYDPNAAGGGRFATRLTKGALRFVGGEISHTAGATITTPVATLGIRGGAALVTHDAACESQQAGNATEGCTTIICTGGRCSVQSGSISRAIQLRVNQAVEIGNLGAVRFTVTSVNLGDVADGGGKGSAVAGKSGNNRISRFSAQTTIDQTIQEQVPEPAPPAPPQ